jgi:hypothetical protein
MIVLWVLFGLAVVSWAGLGALFAYIWAIPPGDRAKDMGLALAALWMFLLAIPLSLPGGVAGVWLAARLDTPGLRIIVGIAGGIMLTAVTLVMLAFCGGADTLGSRRGRVREPRVCSEVQLAGLDGGQ